MSRVFGDLQLTQISLNFKIFSSNLKTRSLVAKLCVTFLLLWFWKKRLTFNKNEMESKMENPTHSFRETNLFNIRILSQCLVCWIHSQNIHTFTYTNFILINITSYTFLLVFRIAENLKCILNEILVPSFAWLVGYTRRHLIFELSKKYNWNLKLQYWKNYLAKLYYIYKLTPLQVETQATWTVKCQAHCQKCWRQVDPPKFGCRPWYKSNISY